MNSIPRGGTRWVGPSPCPLRGHAVCVCAMFRYKCFSDVPFLSFQPFAPRGGTQPMLFPEFGSVCIPSFRFVGTRVCLAIWSYSKCYPDSKYVCGMGLTCKNYKCTNTRDYNFI